MQTLYPDCESVSLELSNAISLPLISRESLRS